MLLRNVRVIEAVVEGVKVRKSGEKVVLKGGINVVLSVILGCERGFGGEFSGDKQKKAKGKEDEIMQKDMSDSEYKQKLKRELHDLYAMVVINNAAMIVHTSDSDNSRKDIARAFIDRSLRPCVCGIYSIANAYVTPRDYLDKERKVFAVLVAEIIVLSKPVMSKDGWIRDIFNFYLAAFHEGCRCHDAGEDMIMPELDSFAMHMEQEGKDVEAAFNRN